MGSRRHVMSSVFADNRSIVHKGDGKTNVAAPPDVCKTPSPGGPVPVPYVNAARTSDLAGGTKSIQIEGNPVALKSSNLSTSTGDEPGTAGGVVSGKVKGKMTWTSSSPDVRFEGKAVVRFMDVTLHNGNTGNTTFMENGGVGYGGDFDTYRCDICRKPYEKHRTPETAESKNKVGELRKKLLDALEPKLDALAEFVRVERERFEYSQQRKDLEKALARLADPTVGLSELEVAAEKLKLEGQVAAVAQKITDCNRRKKDAEKRGRNDILKRTVQGYMIGVMICRAHGGGFATHSGKDVTPGFDRIAQASYKVCKEAISKEEASACNPRLTGARADTFSRAWDTCVANNTAQHGGDQTLRDKGESWNTPGECAAPKLLKHSKNHTPRCITESWFDPFEMRVIKLTYFAVHNEFRHRLKRLVSALTYGLFDFSRERMKAVFKDDETVPSCNTCQKIVSLMSCDNDQPCG